MKILLLLVLFSVHAFAVSESNIEQSLQASILPYFQSQAIEGHFEGVGGLDVHYFTISNPNAKRVLVLAPGQGEPSIKYAEFVYDLRDLGFTIFLIDHRSQGESGRPLPDPQKVHIDHFSDYTADFSSFVANVVHPENYDKSFLFGVSMGGAIAADYVRENPSSFSNIVLVSPMFQINSGSIPYFIAQRGLELMDLEGSSKVYAPSQSDYDPKDPFVGNDVTSSSARFMVRQEILNSKSEYGSGGGTVRWVLESMKKSDELRKMKGLFQVPTLIFQASEDTVVVPAAEARVCSNSADNCRLISVQGAKHEILMEKDLYRSPMLEQIRTFLTQ